MKASSFFWGIVVGVAASSWLAKGRLPMLSSGSSRNVVDQAKHKMMEMTFPGMDGFSSKPDHHTEPHKTGPKSSRVVSPQEKEENMNMLKDFIRTNPDVKHEVEQILSQTNTTVPGL
ncbi:hypothetical protein HUB98_05135 [Paenibacillus barcinonensis]|uniref:Uncharacterized protein n=1 Tax=Paenibacillus barcinonensis TaxID=198119 RepID=A0A2V4VCW4_PAEBA|nr:hypothetical protein [Paenibacillus barcinonensis]PYE51368.1 hypothetical protein DFQ00_102161 [Paenibacillus barcinonensis]QKS55766.1 hypothetical protein HUB98_05135 [Paenibacillus barcinonensis]